ncbi:hypothetical protein F5148DRAFT_1339860 [Russula earlei]|uniref:Uncharacterized protein n=1 Tax=Russula earlei TaxID=71964 RepID=A0ACC0UMR3_9AGAM|nr:hypothetical protein F5148DRAFT_1339860 [Russula earlei]
MYLIGPSTSIGSPNVALQLFGAEPPMALYRVASPLEGRTASANTIESERMKAYLALSSSDVLSISSDHSSVHLSQSDASIVSISIATPKPPTHDVDPSQESEDDPTQSVFRSDPNDDSSPGPHDPYRPWDDATATTFRRRRLRAAKLTQFFGVAYNDLSIPKVTPTSGHEADVEMAPPTEEVGVKIQERGRFWNRADGPNKAGGHDADMSDVIALLRQMPRA